MVKELEEKRKEAFRQRTKAFASAVIRLFCSLPKQRPGVQIMGKQLLRSGTSVAANYREASRARSAAEFVAKIDQCAQEADESLLWLELLRDDCAIKTGQLDEIYKEANGLIAIFVTMSKNVKQRLKTWFFFPQVSGFIPHPYLWFQISSLIPQWPSGSSGQWCLG